MTEKYKLLGKYIKDLSSETKDTETYIFVRENISKYKLGIDITSKPLKNKMIEVNTAIKSTVTFKILSIFLCSLMVAELIPIKVISA